MQSTPATLTDIAHLAVLANRQHVPYPLEEQLNMTHAQRAFNYANSWWTDKKLDTDAEQGNLIDFTQERNKTVDTMLHRYGSVSAAPENLKRDYMSSKYNIRYTQRQLADMGELIPQAQFISSVGQKYMQRKRRLAASESDEKDVITPDFISWLTS